LVLDQRQTQSLSAHAVQRYEPTISLSVDGDAFGAGETFLFTGPTAGDYLSTEAAGRADLCV
jgi:hypothetical protein